MNSVDFMRKQKEEPQETELEREVRECSHMILKTENLKKPFWINPNPNDNTKIEIGVLDLKSEEDVICELTKKPCILYNPGVATHRLFPHIAYYYLKRCPSSEDSIKRYKLRGKKIGSLFYTAEIERIKEEK